MAQPEQQKQSVETQQPSAEQQSQQNVPISREQQNRPARFSANDPWRPLTNLRRQIDHLFEDFDRMTPFWPFGRSAFEMAPFGRAISTAASTPAVDIVEQDQAIVITAELPGMDENNIELKLANGALLLKGEKQDEREEQNQGYYVSERTYGSFQRSFGLPENIDVDNIEAHFDKGVLTITLPKRPEALPQEKVIGIKSKRGEQQAQGGQMEQGEQAEQQQQPEE